MAVAVTGGLITATVLSLLAIPGVFTHIDDRLAGFERARSARPSAVAQYHTPPLSIGWRADATRTGAGKSRLRRA